MDKNRYELADLSTEQRELLDKVEHTTGLVLVAYDQDTHGGIGRGSFSE